MNKVRRKNKVMYSMMFNQLLLINRNKSQDKYQNFRKKSTD